LAAVFLAPEAAPGVALAGVRRPITLRAALAVRPARKRVLVRAIERAFLVAKAVAAATGAARNRSG
jgi:hypothetical protein